MLRTLLKSTNARVFDMQVLQSPLLSKWHGDKKTRTSL